MASSENCPRQLKKRRRCIKALEAFLVSLYATHAVENKRTMSRYELELGTSVGSMLPRSNTTYSTSSS